MKFSIKSAFLFLFLTLLLSCEDSQSPIPINFGDDYLLSSGWCGTPPVAPVASIRQNQLYIGLFYEGGCIDHSFALNEVSDGNALYLWLYHDAKGDTCQNPVWDGYSQFISQSMVQADAIYVLDPEGSDMIQIK